MTGRAPKLFGVVVFLLLGCGTRSALEERSSTTGGDDLDAATIDAGDGSCEGLACRQAVCEAGTHTTLRGTTFAPNGTLALPNVLVYVPTAPLSPLPSGASCASCEPEVSGKPLVSARSNADGTFELVDVPSGKDVPIVIQAGKWRRKITLPMVDACEHNRIEDGVARLPRRRSEGDIPRIAVSLGWCDQLGCTLERLGVDHSELGTSPTAPERVTMYSGTGNINVPGIQWTSKLYNDADEMKRFDSFVLACECEPAHLLKQMPQPLVDYLEAGGHVVATHYQSAWLEIVPQFKPLMKVAYAATVTPFRIELGTPKGKRAADWMSAVMGTTAYGEVTGTDVSWIPEIHPPVQLFVKDAREVPLVVWFGMPLQQSPEKRCGRFVYSVPHMGPEDTNHKNFPKGCDGKPLSQWEKLFAFLLFDTLPCQNG